ncbi:hypothetical protein [Pleomorphomonas sp. JP5]|uniref:hypothetical protein n=1 Tax=Pleomorphomonas sp. JP5 TaxID=2942998 RepID=UPI00204419C2|nr:hypothetical protein [Pleomorphomonas sp. JP5]MCM5558494.1 hypothetical protein [Pleomorphomonas sp. JP5]
MRNPIIRDYNSLLAELVAERKRQGLSQIDMDTVAFIADGYTAKLEAGYKCFGPISLAAVLGALNVALVLVKLDEHGRPLIEGEEVAA